MRCGNVGGTLFLCYLGVEVDHHRNVNDKNHLVGRLTTVPASFEKTHLPKSDLHVFRHVNLAIVVEVWTKCANAHLLRAIENL